jgi:hypothetical protein
MRRTGHNPPRGPSTGWCVLTTANAAGTNGLTCLPKHGEAQDNKFLVTHPMTDQRCLTSAIARRSALTARLSSSSSPSHRSLYKMLVLLILKSPLTTSMEERERWYSSILARTPHEMSLRYRERKPNSLKDFLLIEVKESMESHSFFMIFSKQ